LKCESITFSTRQNRKNVSSLPPLLLYNSPIEEKKEVKYLGLMFTNDLTWTTHINIVYFKTSSIVGLMKYYKHVLCRNALEIIYKSCILSILSYGCIIYSLTIVANLNKLESVQYKAAIATVGVMKGTSREKVYEILAWFSLKDHFRILRLLTFSKIVKGLTPVYLSVHLHVRQPNARYKIYVIIEIQL